jgi:uncharacterized protein YqeY
MLADRITADLRQAMIARDTTRVATLRMLKTALEYHKLETKQEQLGDADAVAVIKKQIKLRQDAIEGYAKGGRPDLAGKEQAELAILKAYLPEELSAAQLEEIVLAAIAEVGARSRADMGRVIKAVQARTAGRADNRLISQLVASRLA